MTNSVAEFEHADVILVTGSNTTEAHPVLSAFMKRGIRSGRTKLIVADPRKIELVRFADIWLRQRPGSDVAWLNGMMNVIIQEDLHDKAYVAERTEGFEELKKAVAAYTPEKVEEIAGIPRETLVAAARLYATAPKASIAYCLGITEHINGTDAVKSVANLAMLCGNVGKESGGVNPLRGQNNVQGACDMGGSPNVYSGYQKVAEPDLRAKMAKAWGVEDLPGEAGLTMVELIQAAAKGTIKGMYIVGENNMLSDPDIDHVEKGLRSLDFLVVQDLFLTETAELADVVLPAACFAEKEGTFTNTERRVQRIYKAVEPPGQARPDWEIICDIGTRMGHKMSFPSAEAVFDEMASVTPSYGGMTYERLKQKGLQWPCPTQDHPGTPYLHKGTFVRGKGLFSAIDWIPPAEPTDEEYPLVLITGRILYHYHTGTMTRRSRPLHELRPECLVQVNEKDADSLGIRNGDPIRLTTRRGSIEAKADVDGIVPTGAVYTNFHFAESPVNRLTIAALDPISKTPEYKVCAVRVERIE